jgi:hypothetical protein
MPLDTTEALIPALQVLRCYHEQLAILGRWAT